MIKNWTAASTINTNICDIPELKHTTDFSHDNDMSIVLDISSTHWGRVTHMYVSKL